MPIRYLTGHSHAVKPRLYEELGAALREGGSHSLVVLVPEQYTLQSEMEIIDALGIPGSFRLQVTSPARLFSRIFAEAGSPEPVRIDERGRTMLMHASLKSLRRELCWYKGAQHRPGFAELAASQIRELKQAGYTPEKLDELSENVNGALKYKLKDLSLIWNVYEEKMVGRFMDGEDELNHAIDRMGRVSFLQGCEVWAYGFELVSPTLAHALLGLEKVARRVNLLLALQNNAASRDFYSFEPVQRSYERLCRMAGEQGVEWTREALPDNVPVEDLRPEIGHMLREINCFPAQPYDGVPKAIRLIMARNPLDEAMTVMALIRELIRTRGWRYRDVAIGCFRMDEYSEVIRRAARLYGVPVFQEGSRPADRNALAQYLLLSLKIISTNWQSDDMRLLLRTGYCDLTDDEADALSNYIIEQGIGGAMWKEPFKRGGEELIEAMEPIRQRVTAYLVALEERMRAAESVSDQLRAVWNMLEETDAFAKLEARQAQAAELGMVEAANECAQVWNRIVGTLDQLHQLMDGKRLPMRDLIELLRESLASTDIKPLPQAGDAVTAGSLSHLRTQQVKLLLLMGCNEARAGDVGGLFQSSERDVLGREQGVWMAPDMMERGRLQDIDLMGVLALARQFVVVSFSQSSAEGSALLPGAIVSRIKTIFPNLTVSGGLDEGEALRRLKYAAPDAALTLLPAELSEGQLSASAQASLSALAAAEGRAHELNALRKALTHRTASEDLPKNLARRLYGGPRSVSITRLEKYASCPFRHFVEYGLRPKKIEPFELRKQDEGSFYHEAMERFLGEEWPDMNGMNIDEAMARMDKITEELLAPMMDGPLGKNPVTLSHSKRMREVARRAAGTATKHLAGSQFAPCALEVKFGEDEPLIVLHTENGELPMQGRIDRIDRWEDGDETWLRIVDYKSGMGELNLTKLYFGLQLQLIIYLAAALEMGACRPAGAFYFKVADPVLSTEERNPDLVEMMRTDELRLSGLFIDDMEVLTAMSPQIEHTIHLALTGKNAVRANPKMLDADGFRLLIEHAMAAAARIADGIRQGKTEVAPVKMSGYCSCDLCDWKTVCQQDARLGGMPRTLPKIEQKHVLDEIRAQMGEAEE